MENKTTITKKKAHRGITAGIAHIYASFNNTIVTITDVQGNTISWSTAGSSGFKGARKSTVFAAQRAAKNASNGAEDCGVKTLDVLVKGPGPGRDAALRTLNNQGFKITSITDVTPLPHNGVRPKKQRRPA